MYKEKLDLTRIPQHIAVIMDGNGRWAKERGMKRRDGHVAGTEALKNILRPVRDLGIKYLTVYAFSTENWNRPDEEVEALMALLYEKLDVNLFMENDVRLCVIGDIGRLPQHLQAVVNNCLEMTANNTKGTLTVALSYSSKWELVEATKKIARRVQDGTLQVDDINESTIDESLNTSFLPEPDLLIRTGGEYRLSNFLLWQCAYAELYFCDTYWPDFDEEELCKAIWNYQQRERRFGKTSEQVIGTMEQQANESTDQ
ncbi:MAG: isoprenyl transferase [Bacteroidaceae bacterium]|nr:isoprenyl transferase [Bacteroidaceae bacterium]